MRKTLIKIYQGKAIYYTESGEIITEAITLEALRVLAYYNKTPANEI